MGFRWKARVDRWTATTKKLTLDPGVKRKRARGGKRVEDDDYDEVEEEKEGGRWVLFKYPPENVKQFGP